MFRSSEDSKFPLIVRVRVNGELEIVSSPSETRVEKHIKLQFEKHTLIIY